MSLKFIFLITKQYLGLKIESYVTATKGTLVNYSLGCVQKNCPGFG